MLKLKNGKMEKMKNNWKQIGKNGKIEKKSVKKSELEKWSLSQWLLWPVSIGSKQIWFNFLF